MTNSLGSLCKVVRGSSPRPKGDPLFYGPGVPRLMVADLTRDGQFVIPTIDSLTPEGAKKSRLMEKGDVVIAVSGNPGLPAILGESACIHDGFVGLQKLESRVDRVYLYWYLKSFHAQINSAAVGAIFKNLTTTQIKNLQIPLPPLEEQKRIAKILDAADALRAKRRQAIAQLDTFLQSTFLELFGDPVTNPKGWDVSKLEDVSQKITDGDHHTPKRCESGIKLLSARNVLNGSIDLNNTDFIDEKEYQRMIKRCYPEKGDILISCSGSIGRVAQIRFEEPCALVRSAALVKPTLNKINPTYLESMLRTNGMHAMMLNSAKSSSQANLFQKPIKNLKVTIPPLELQQHFASIVESVEHQKSKMQSHLTQLDTLFASLQQRAFNGEL